jgi:hypothetical protein
VPKSLIQQTREVPFADVAFKFYFAGSFYGQLICSRGRNCLVVDVFAGAKVLPPQLPFGDNTNFYYGMLTAPLASPNSHTS